MKRIWCSPQWFCLLSLARERLARRLLFVFKGWSKSAGRGCRGRLRLYQASLRICRQSCTGGEGALGWMLYDRLGRKLRRSGLSSWLSSYQFKQRGRQARAKIVTVAAPPRNTNDKTTTGLTVRQVWAGLSSGLAPRFRRTPAILHIKRITGVSSRPPTPGIAESRRADLPNLPDANWWRIVAQTVARYELLLIAIDGSSAPSLLHRQTKGLISRPFECRRTASIFWRGRGTQNGDRPKLLGLCGGRLRPCPQAHEAWGTPKGISLSLMALRRLWLHSSERFGRARNIHSFPPRGS